MPPQLVKISPQITRAHLVHGESSAQNWRKIAQVVFKRSVRRFYPFPCDSRLRYPKEKGSFLSLQSWRFAAFIH
jgi:hypothetical protein